MVKVEVLRDDSLSQMAGPLSHALRNPLGTISLHLGIIEEEIQQLDGDKRGQAERSLSIVHEHVTRLHDLIHQYLLAGRSWNEPRHAVDVGDYLHVFCAEMHSVLAAYDITLQLEIASQIGAITVYEKGFHQALLHLFHHVRTAMPRGGTLTVRGHRQGDRVSIEICAIGQGITQTQLDHIFDPFHDPAYASNGLGLYLVREVIYAHQGDLSIHSEVDVGTTIQITLPLLRPLNSLSEQRPED
jgi:signal transduction histidine kinase